MLHISTIQYGMLASIGSGGLVQQVRSAKSKLRVYRQTLLPQCPVNSHTEWHPLEEVLVGHIDDATIPANHRTVTCNIPRSTAAIYPFFGGRRYPGVMTRPAKRELAEFIHILEAEGVRVRRPDPQPFHKRYSTPTWSSRGFTCACPRDSMLVIGDEIIETPMAWRSRYFETFAYRSLLREYFAEGAKWTAAPKPELNDDLYNHEYIAPKPGEPIPYVTTEHEPVFDAADFVRCGRDIFVIRSNVTNYAGIQWLRRHLGDGYRIIEIESRCPQPMHIDTTFMPLAPGKLLVNPEYLDVKSLPRMFSNWDILITPEPDPIDGRLLKLTSMCGKWLSMNVLMLDEKRVICERKQPTMMRALKDWGFEPIPCAFQHYAAFGGAFHCATLDIRRRGELQSYFD
jgi:glycine amidinotransferase